MCVIFDSDVTIEIKPFIFIANSSFFAVESLPQAKAVVIVNIDVFTDIEIISISVEISMYRHRQHYL